MHLQVRITYEEEKTELHSESMSSTMIEIDTSVHKEHAHDYPNPYIQVKKFSETVIPSV